MVFRGQVRPYRCMATGSVRVPLELDTSRDTKALLAILNFRGRVLSIAFDDALLVEGEFGNFSVNHDGNAVLPLEIYQQFESAAIGPLSRMKNLGMLVKIELTVAEEGQAQKRKEEFRKRNLAKVHTLFREADRKYGYQDGFYKQMFKTQWEIESLSALTDTQLYWVIENVQKDLAEDRKDAD